MKRFWASLTLCNWLKLRRFSVLGTGEHVEQRELSHIVGESVEWCKPLSIF